jgi:acyl-CoA synthetase (AMP-forming)/AMP-acid ligase II
VGDIGHLDADGYLYIVDRRVDMIVTGGANVFPAQVELVGEMPRSAATKMNRGRLVEARGG